MHYLKGIDLTGLEQFRFHELNRAPEAAGVYSWYYRIELADHDIAVCQEELTQASTSEEKATIVDEFLQQRLFKPYLEAPYSVSLQGPLKPSYSGEARNVFHVPHGLVSRIVEDPARLPKLKSLLLRSVPHFASPIYIGVAKVLRGRLLRHKFLIERFANAAASEVLEGEGAQETDEEALRDHSFAREVATIRKFNTTNLLVCTMPLDVDEHVRYDLENVLNRLNFPLCGRN